MTEYSHNALNEDNFREMIERLKAFEAYGHEALRRGASKEDLHEALQRAVDLYDQECLTDRKYLGSDDD